MRLGYLGPPGTFSEEAARRATANREAELVPFGSIHEAVIAVDRGMVDRALVPVENSLEGGVTATLDALAWDAPDTVILGEAVLPIRNCLIAREQIALDAIEAVISHPQPLAQCARFLRENLAGAAQESAPSTAEAVRTVGESEQPWAAIGAAAAAELYGCTVLREGIEDEANNVTRFVWIAPKGTEPGEGEAWKTSLVFSELGEDHPGALVEALQEFSGRAVNLSRIESRPLRRELGRYMFFCDLEGALSEPPVSAAVEALRGKAESVRILGSYPTR
jgi:prephenate dehydratase